MNKLVTVTNKDLIKSLNRENITLLYPLKGFCVGYETEFEIEEINDYCLINRILPDDDLELLESILLNSNIKGIVFDDLGVIDVVKDLDITKILLLDHIATNTESINNYLEYVDSVIVSNDLTKDEIKKIVNNSNKPLVVNVFGLKTLMYSRRFLLTNYQKYHNLDLKQNEIATIEDKNFKIVENEYGTKFYAYPYYEALELLKLNNVLYYWYDPIFLEADKIISLVLDDDIKDIPCSKIFLNTPTIYKVGDIDD